MSVIEALKKACTMLETCNVCVRDVRIVGEAMDLINASIHALSVQQAAPAAEEMKEEAK